MAQHKRGYKTKAQQFESVVRDKAGQVLKLQAESLALQRKGAVLQLLLKVASEVAVHKRKHTKLPSLAQAADPDEPTDDFLQAHGVPAAGHATARNHLDLNRLQVSSYEGLQPADFVSKYSPLAQRLGLMLLQPTMGQSTEAPLAAAIDDLKQLLLGTLLWSPMTFLAMSTQHLETGAPLSPDPVHTEGVLVGMQLNQQQEEVLVQVGELYRSQVAALEAQHTKLTQQLDIELAQGSNSSSGSVATVIMQLSSNMQRLLTTHQLYSITVLQHLQDLQLAHLFVRSYPRFPCAYNLLSVLDQKHNTQSTPVELTDAFGTHKQVVLLLPTSRVQLQAASAALRNDTAPYQQQEGQAAAAEGIRQLQVAAGQQDAERSSSTPKHGSSSTAAAAPGSSRKRGRSPAAGGAAAHAGSSKRAEAAARNGRGSRQALQEDGAVKVEHAQLWDPAAAADPVYAKGLGGHLGAMTAAQQVQLLHDAAAAAPLLEGAAAQHLSQELVAQTALALLLQQHPQLLGPVQNALCLQQQHQEGWQQLQQQQQAQLGAAGAADAEQAGASAAAAEAGWLLHQQGSQACAAAAAAPHALSSGLHAGAANQKVPSSNPTQDLLCAVASLLQACSSVSEAATAALSAGHADFAASTVAAAEAAVVAALHTLQGNIRVRCSSAGNGGAHDAAPAEAAAAAGAVAEQKPVNTSDASTAAAAAAGVGLPTSGPSAASRLRPPTLVALTDAADSQHATEPQEQQQQQRQEQQQEEQKQQQRHAGSPEASDRAHVLEELQQLLEQRQQQGGPNAMLLLGQVLGATAAKGRVGGVQQGLEGVLQLHEQQQQQQQPLRPPQPPVVLQQHPAQDKAAAAAGAAGTSLPPASAAPAAAATTAVAAAAEEDNRGLVGSGFKADSPSAGSSTTITGQSDRQHTDATGPTALLGSTLLQQLQQQQGAIGPRQFESRAVQGSGTHILPALWGAVAAGAAGHAPRAGQVQGFMTTLAQLLQVHQAEGAGGIGEPARGVHVMVGGHAGASGGLVQQQKRQRQQHQHQRQQHKHRQQHRQQHKQHQRQRQPADTVDPAAAAAQPRQMDQSAALAAATLIPPAAAAAMAAKLAAAKAKAAGAAATPPANNSPSIVLNSRPAMQAAAAGPTASCEMEAMEADALSALEMLAAAAASSQPA